MIEKAGTAGSPKMTRYRWTICALLFGATTINYVDRQIFSLLIPFFEDDLKLGPTDLALLNIAFLIMYGLGMMFVGRFVDIIGTKKGFGIAFLVWSAASVLHGAATGLTSMFAFRAILGLGESANFPASVKTVTDWFPRKERATAIGWFNSGSNIGVVIAAALAGFIAQSHLGGWRTCFIVLGLLGACWIFFWKKHYYDLADHPKVSPEEVAHIRSDSEETNDPVSYNQLFAMRPVYAAAVAKFFSDAPWWFYLTWMPKFLVDEFNLNVVLVTLTIPIYIIADIGAVGGGWLSSRFIANGNDAGTARKKTMLICALAVLPVFFVGSLTKTPTVLGIPSYIVAVAIVSLGAAAHQGWSSNLFTVISDTMPKQAVARTVGISTFFGVLGAALFQVYVGKAVAARDYTGPFMLASVLYLFGLLGLHLLLPKFKVAIPNKKVSLVTVSAVAVVLISSIFYLQYQLNRPKYANLDDFMEKRSAELKVEGQPKQGPDAMVGWMKAQWYEWPNGKRDLVKFDTAKRPILESKGSEAKKYVGLFEEELDGTFLNK